MLSYSKKNVKIARKMDDALACLVEAENSLSVFTGGQCGEDEYDTAILNVHRFEGLLGSLRKLAEKISGRDYLRECFDIIGGVCLPEFEIAEYNMDSVSRELLKIKTDIERLREAIKTFLEMEGRDVSKLPE